MTSIPVARKHCEDCGEQFTEVPGHPGHSCSAPNNTTGIHVGDTVKVGRAVGQVMHLQIRGDVGFAEVYFRPTFRSYWYPTEQIERVAA